MPFYFALLGVLAITSVMAAPTQSVNQATLLPARPGGNIGSLLANSHLVLGKGWHRVLPGGEANWPQHRALDDIINFKMIGGDLHVAYMRFIPHTIDNKDDPLKGWCLTQEDAPRLLAHFRSDHNYAPVKSLTAQMGNYPSTGY
jgi:hypothetical protein